MLSACAAIVRRHDPDRFLAALFAPPARRAPTLALIRLVWWRDVVEGACRRHEVAAPLTAILNAGLLDLDDLLALITAREIETEPAIPILAAWRDYLRGCAGRLAIAAGRLLGTSAAALPRLGALGAASAIVSR